MRYEDHGTDAERELGPRERRRNRDEEDDVELEREWQESNPDNPRGCIVRTPEGAVLAIDGFDDIHDEENPWKVRYIATLEDERVVWFKDGNVYADEAPHALIGRLEPVPTP